MDVAKSKCVEFSTHKVEKLNLVVLIGFVYPTLKIKGKMELVLVTKPSIFVGKIL
jgi:hypothetical protein